MTLRPAYVHTASIVLVIIGLGFIGFLYFTQPKTLAEVATKSQVAMGTYQIDKAEFDRGLVDFRRDDFPGARAAFDRSDPERRDPGVQFYVAYSYYRQGWGRLSNDDALFQQGIAAVDRVIALQPAFRTTDEGLQMKTPTELKTEFEEGVKLTPSDLNPLKVFRERK